MQHIIDQIREELIASADEKIRAGSQRFFKEPVKSHGVKTATVSKVSKAWFKKIDTLPKPEIYVLCEQLWQSGYLEESFIACNWAYFLHKQYKPEDFKVFEKWLSTSQTIGPFSIVSLARFHMLPAISNNYLFVK
jgi:3-methyladenine DNA glycosylase AlkD